MRQVVMSGGPAENAVHFRYMGTENEAAAATRFEGSIWAWNVGVSSGYEASYTAALERILVELKARGVCVPELEPVVPSASMLGRDIALGFVALVLAFTAALWFASAQGCDSAPKVSPAPVLWKWEQPELEVRISDALDPCKKASAIAALAWWEQRLGEHRFNWSIVPADQMDITGIPPRGVIEIVAEPPLDPVPLETTEVWPVKSMPGYAYSAQVRVRGCTMGVWVHAGGHILGLGHAAGDSELMAIPYKDAWGLLKEELDPL